VTARPVKHGAVLLSMARLRAFGRAPVGAFPYLVLALYAVQVLTELRRLNRL